MLCIDKFNETRKPKDTDKDARGKHVEVVWTMQKTLSGQKEPKRAVWEVKFLNSIL